MAGTATGGSVRVKICGLCRQEDLDAAVAAGADAVGFVFVPRSPRHLALERASELASSVPPFVTRVGLFLDAGEDEVRATLQAVPLDMLQFHGREPAAWCRQFGLPYLKAVSASADSFDTVEREYGDAAGLLVDSHEPGGLGGTGRTVDWDKVKLGRLPLILAGGLTPDNVAEAVRTVRPWAVDVSSGVESAPGVKDPEAIRRFIEKAKRGD